MRNDVVIIAEPTPPRVYGVGERAENGAAASESGCR
jgi:hypothetical protein